jgi:hypothetical protein
MHALWSYLPYSFFNIIIDIYYLFIQENLGYVEINLSDVVSNKRINEKYHLIDSKNGKIQIELQWRTP